MEKDSIHFILMDGVNDIRPVVDSINKSTRGIICLLSRKVRETIENDWIINHMKNTDVLHCGLSVHLGIPFNDLQLCTFDWHFINPEPYQPSVSWKPSCDLMAFDKNLFVNLGGFDTNFKEVLSSLVDFSYRVLRHGGLSLNVPYNDIQGQGLKFQRNISDEIRFIRKHIGKRAVLFYRLCMFVLYGKFLIKRDNGAVLDSKLLRFIPRYFQINDRGKMEYSAIIPTINRYEYLKGSIESLLKLSDPPSEIIVIDQTIVSQRNSSLLTEYIDTGIVKIIYLDKPGQSTARNAGIQMAKHDWLLLFEDDAEAWPEMVNEHKWLLRNCLADISTGVVVGPDKDIEIIPKVNRKYFLSDIFTTGNAFLAKSTVTEVKGFDPAFDRGPGADDDFGKRLYKKGFKIVYNYKSIETHYKAPKGGMREHGAWWRNKSTLLGAFPPATQLYAIRKYYSKDIQKLLILSLILKAKKRHTWPSYILFWFLLPLKLFKSTKEVQLLTKN